MSDEKEEFGMPDRADRPRRDGQGPRTNRSESSREQRPNRYGVPRDNQSRNDRDSRPYRDRSDRPQRSDRPRYGDRDGAAGRGERSERRDRPYRPSGERPNYSDRGDRPSRSDRGGYTRGDSTGAPRGESRGSQRAGRASFGERTERPRYGDRSQRSDRPVYGDRGAHPERGERSQRSYGDRPQRGDRTERSFVDRPQRGDRPSYEAPGQRSERPRYPDRGGRPDRPGAPRTGGRDGSNREERRPRFEEIELTPEQKMARELRMVRSHHDDPWIDDDVTDEMLDKVARNELKTLTKENAERVAKHLVMAVRLLDENPELAHQHVISAARRAGRIAVVRETLGITAYATGDFALALRELRTYRRISGSNEQIALMVDSERGVGRPDKGLELGRSVDKSTLTEPTQVALAIAMSGARLDLNQVDLALAELEIPQLDPTKAFSYSPALFRAYAEVLEELGRHQEAAEWITCAEVAERALIEANIIASQDEDDQDVVVFEEELEGDGLETDSNDLDLSLADAVSAGNFEDVLEDDVREILAETAHLDQDNT